jgi:aerotaxis receptor
VKNLATETARSTEEIGRQIAAIQGVTAEAVKAVAQIGGTIGEISEVATAIAAAMEEQSAATQEIARNVADSGAAVRDMARRVAEVSQDVARTGEVAAEVRAGSGEVDASIGELQSALVKVVRTSMREADRRLQRRYEVTEPCSVDRGGQRLPATLVDISAYGALIGGVSGFVAGDRGEIELPRRGGVRAGFVVRDVTMRGMHVTLAEATLGEPWWRAFEAMTGERPRQEAA